MSGDGGVRRSAALVGLGQGSVADPVRLIMTTRELVGPGHRRALSRTVISAALGERGRPAPRGEWLGRPREWQGWPGGGRPGRGR